MPMKKDMMSMMKEEDMPTEEDMNEIAALETTESDTENEVDTEEENTDDKVEKKPVTQEGKNVSTEHVSVNTETKKCSNETESTNTFRMLYPEDEGDDQLDSMTKTVGYVPQPLPGPPPSPSPVPPSPPPEPSLRHPTKGGKCFLSVENCGKRSQQLVGEKTLGGRVALNSEFPWHVAVQMYTGRDYIHLCSGALILDRWIVTTASCVKNYGMRKLVVVLGSNNALELQTDAIELKVDKKIINEGYSKETLENNIALLRLSEKPEKSFPEIDFINSVCLCIPRKTPSKTLAVSGWGRKPDRLHTLDVNILNEDACKMYYKHYFIEEQMICAGDVKGRRDASEGDQGAPLVLTEDGQSYLFGIHSYYTEHHRTVYIRISHYVPWIKRVVDKYCHNKYN
ncbi:trypsin-1-like protein [Leptotrombidium deliense]|uniref:Trypsin-1-like protein n=1 Tax=Leptotrombidium deliense TaxID=299467 RepID=A0A443SLD2_9ACAR|nr:trypsin-1-like protein [Leptotrombidium deliense]